MSFEAIMRQKFPHLYPSLPTQATHTQEPLPVYGNQYAHQPVPASQEQPAPVQPATPAVVQNIANTVNTFMPALEQITGLTRREIFLHLLKTGLKGGSFESMISGLLGQATTPPADAKFVRYVKTLAIWVPVALLLTGISIVSVIVFAKFLLSMV